VGKRGSFIRRHADSIGVALLIGGAAFIVWYLLLSASGPRLPDPNSRQFAVDFRDYWLAAGRMAQGISPYAAKMLEGPLGSQGFDVYRYPPVLAALLVPLSGLDYITAGWVWAGVSVIALSAGLAIALRAGGTDISARVALWTGVATVWFFPTLDSLWKGNVEGLQVLLLALALVSLANARGPAVVAAAWLKIAPVLLLPALLARDGWRGLVWLFAASAVLVLPTFLLAPTGFWQLPQILVNIAGADSVVSSNLAPHSWITILTGSTTVGDLVRLTAIAGAAVLVLISVHLARRPNGWPAAVVAGTAAALLGPGAIWSHYLLVLLPLALYAWPRLSFDDRARLLIAGAGLSVFELGLVDGLAGPAADSAVQFIAAAVWLGLLLKNLWPAKPASLASALKTP
jgi:hypothetical protein